MQGCSSSVVGGQPATNRTIMGSVWQELINTELHRMSYVPSPYIWKLQRGVWVGRAPESDDYLGVEMRITRTTVTVSMESSLGYEYGRIYQGQRDDLDLGELLLYILTHHEQDSTTR